VVRGLAVGVVVTLIALFFTHLQVEHLPASGRGAAHVGHPFAARVRERGFAKNFSTRSASCRTFILTR